jgi:hypothetical protein
VFGLSTVKGLLISPTGGGRKERKKERKNFENINKTKKYTRIHC